MLNLKAAKCSVCSCFIYSRCYADYRRCLCGKISVGGEPREMRVMYSPDVDPPIILDIEVDAEDELVLQNDWITKADRYGLIKHVEVTRGGKVPPPMLPIIWRPQPLMLPIVWKPQIER